MKIFDPSSISFKMIKNTLYCMYVAPQSYYMRTPSASLNFPLNLASFALESILLFFNNKPSEDSSGCNWNKKGSSDSFVGQ